MTKSARTVGQDLMTSRSRQQGVALVALVLLIMVTFGFFGLRQLNSSVRQTVLTASTERTLALAKEALIAYVMLPGEASPGRMPIPDVATASSPNYDGLSDSNCVHRTWVSGTDIPSTTTLTLRCVGRLPWKKIGLQLENLPAENDPDGVMPWFAFSPRLLPSSAPSGCSYLNSNYINNNSVANCGAAWPWITVVDAKGVVLTNRAAAVIIIPGPKLFTQNRTVAPLADSSAYLDRVVVQAGCTMPCVPGTYDNSRRRILGFTAAADNSIGLRFIQCADISTVASNDPNYAHPYRCNDKLTWITIDELMEHAERRALAEVRSRLNQFYQTYSYMPYASPVGTIDCATPALATDQSFGHIPSGNVADSLTGCPSPPPPVSTPPTPPAVFTTQMTAPAYLFTWPSWFIANSWAEAIYYHPAPGCLLRVAAPRCQSDLLEVGTKLDVHAVLIATGQPITASPFAPSKGSAQTGWGTSGMTGSGSMNDYLDSVTNALGGNTKKYDAANTPRTRDYKDQLLIVAP